MPFEYLDHTSDVCIRATSNTLSDAFCEAARAMFNLMVDIRKVNPKRSININVSAYSVETLLVEWLGELLSRKDLSGLVFSQFDASIEDNQGIFNLSGSAFGEALDASRHDPRTEVKGATYAGLRVWQENGQFIAKCVVDV
jgi:SHS2 domain-containing protein